MNHTLDALADTIINVSSDGWFLIKASLTSSSWVMLFAVDDGVIPPLIGGKRNWFKASEKFSGIIFFRLAPIE